MYSCNEIPYRNEEEQTIATCNNMENLSNTILSQWKRAQTVAAVHRVQERPLRFMLLQPGQRGSSGEWWKREGASECWESGFWPDSLNVYASYVHFPICVLCFPKKLKIKSCNEQENMHKKSIYIKTMCTLRKAWEVHLWAKNKIFSCHDAQGHPLLPFCALVWVPK